MTLFRHDPYLYLGTSAGVYRSDLAAANWQQADIQALANRTTAAFAADGSRLFVGVNYRADHWLWSTESYGPPWDFRAHEFASLFSLAVAHGRLWAGRIDGLWSMDMSGWTGVDQPVGAPARFILHQNFPNPFNPSTTIAYDLHASAQVTLKLYDALGREVQTLVDQHQAAGSHKVTLTATGLASGMYVYRLAAGGVVHARSLVVLR